MVVGRCCAELWRLASRLPGLSFRFFSCGRDARAYNKNPLSEKALVLTEFLLVVARGALPTKGYKSGQQELEMMPIAVSRVSF